MKVFRFNNNLYVCLLCFKCFIKSRSKSNQSPLYYIEKLEEKHNLAKVMRLVSGRPRCKPRCLHGARPPNLFNVFHMLLLKWTVKADIFSSFSHVIKRI